MIKFLFAFVVLLSYGASAYAADFWWQAGTGAGASFRTAEAACRSTFEKYGSAYQFHSAPVSGDGKTALCYYTLNGSSNPTLNGTMYRYDCPASAPFRDHALGSCVTTPPVDPNECADKNPMIRRWDYSGSGFASAPDHFGNCKVVPLEMLVCRKDAATGKTYCMWMVQRTGERWSGTEAPGDGGSTVPEKPSEPPVASPPIKPPSPSAPDICKTCVPCPKGTVQAGIGPDGVPMCVGTGTNPPPPPSPPPVKTTPPVTTTNPDGSTTTTTTTTQTNADGSTSTTTHVVTKAPDGSTTTSGGTVVSATPAGKAGHHDDPTGDADKNNFCKQNPTLAVCRDSTVSGTCGEISCTGDAVQCATLRAAAAMECKQRKEEDALKDSSLHSLGQAAAGGVDPQGDTLPAVKNAAVVQVPSMSGSHGWLGAGAVFKDVSFTVQGHTVSVPLSKWTSYLEAFRYALMVVASLVSFRLLSGSILRD